MRTGIKPSCFKRIKNAFLQRTGAMFNKKIWNNALWIVSSSLLSSVVCGQSMYVREDHREYRKQQEADNPGTTEWHTHPNQPKEQPPTVEPDRGMEPAIKATDALHNNRFDIPNKKVEGHWEELGPLFPPEGANKRQLGVGRINSVSFDPSNALRMFVCSPSGGMWYSEDGGENWTNGGTDGLPVAGAAWLLANPRDPANWILATGDGDGRWTPSAGIYITYDKGKHWQPINDGLPLKAPAWNPLLISKLAGHPKNWHIIYAATNKGLFACNIRQTQPRWKPIYKGQFNDIVFKPFRPNVIWASGETIIRTEDGGRTWKEVPGAAIAQIGYQTIKTNLEVTPADPGLVYAAVTGSDKTKGTYKARVYAWHDSTQTWEPRGGIEDRSYLPYGLIPGRNKAFVVSPDDPNELYAANVNPVYYSKDGGKTWLSKPYGMHDDIHHLQFAPGGKVMWATNDGGIYKSTNRGQTWENKTKGIGVTNVLGLSIANSLSGDVIIGTYDTGSALFDKQKQHWTFKSGGDGCGNMFDPRFDSVYYTSTTLGTVWRHESNFRKNVASAPRNGSDWQTWVDYNRANPDVIYQCGTSIWRSSDRGKNGTWESILQVKDLFPGYEKAIRLYPAPGDGAVLYAVLIGKKPVRLIRTQNAMDEADKVTWEALKHPENSWIADLAIDEKDPEKFWMVYNMAGNGANSKVWFYNGKWKRMNDDLPDFLAASSIVYEEGSKGKVFIGTNAGVFYSDHRFKNWFLLKGLPHCDARFLRINTQRQKLVAGTFGRGVWECDLPEIPKKTRGLRAFFRFFRKKY